MKPALGLRIVRGPDWKWGDQDGGEGYVGTVVGLEEGEVIVQWDMGQRCRYRCGRDHKYDLRVLDCAQIGIRHGSIKCVICKKKVYGFLWRCVHCFEAGSMCSECYMAGQHSTTHSFVRIDEENGPRVKVEPRGAFNQPKAKLFGMFREAVVVRGHDWIWGDQDGGSGMEGKVIEITNWKENFRIAARVSWSKGVKNGNYRLGTSGKVDLICSIPAFGGPYYPDHLPVLDDGRREGDDDDKTVQAEEKVIIAGDRVRVDLDKETWKNLEQEERESWDDTMADFIGTVGVVQHISDSNVLIVNYPGLATLPISIKAVTKVEDETVYEIGDVVKVKEEKEHVLKEQRGHGGWRDEMTECLGKVGRVVKVLPSGDVQVEVSDRRWVFSPSSFNKATGQEEPTGEGGGVQLSEQVKGQLEVLEEMAAPELVVAASAAGDIDTLRKYLENNQKEVGKKVKGKTGLMVAVAEGWPEIIKLLLQYKADANQPDGDGDTALHYCAHLEREDIAEALLSHGADPNITNKDGAFPLLYAVALGNYRVMRLLLNKNCDLNLKDNDGNTALHAAVAAHRSEAVKLLLGAGADPTLSIESHHSPILSTAITGFYLGLEEFIKTNREGVASVKDNDGNTVLHLAVSNNHLDLVCLLTEKEACDLEATNTVKQTALHIAAREGHTRVIEHLLVHCRANPDVTDAHGYTPLQLVIINKDNVKAPSEFSQHTVQIYKDLHNSRGAPEYYKAVSCLLVKYGAIYNRDILINDTQFSCSVDFMTSLASYAEKRSSTGNT